MTKLQLAIISLIVATFIINYEPIYCNDGEAVASSAAFADGEGAHAEATAAAGGEGGEGSGRWVDGTASEFEEPVFLDPNQGNNAFSQDESFRLLRQGVANEATANPNLYDQEDIEALMNDDNVAIQFLNQRSNDWRRAYNLAVKVFRWRARTGINFLTASHFPCDLFRLGLIFEQGMTHERAESGEYVPGNPVIWIRLGALGSVIRYLEKFTPKRIINYTINTTKGGLSGALDLAHHLIKPRQQRIRRHPVPVVQDHSLKNERTVNHVFMAIAWWLQDWRAAHAPGQQATLVLDFENTDFAMSSSFAVGFFIGLDDRFPDLFDQILGYRFKLKIASLHSPVSAFNKLFKSRIISAPETDRKLKYVKLESGISTYMPRVDVNGYTMLPEHVAGHCVDASRPPPPGCLEETEGVDTNNLFDAQLWQAIHNEFYQACKPKPRGPIL